MQTWAKNRQLFATLGVDFLTSLVKQIHIRQCVQISVSSVDYVRENNHVQLILT